MYFPRETYYWLKGKNIKTNILSWCLWIQSMLIACYVNGNQTTLLCQGVACELKRTYINNFVVKTKQSTRSRANLAKHRHASFSDVSKQNVQDLIYDHHFRFYWTTKYAQPPIGRGILQIVHAHACIGMNVIRAISARRQTSSLSDIGWYSRRVPIKL